MKKILVVEDNEYLREIIIFLCRDLMNFEVFGAGRGREAMLLIAEHRDLDLLISDFRLPDYNGLEIAREAKKSEGVKVIIITGEAETMGESIVASGVVDILLPKPFGVKDLRSVILRLLPSV